MKRTGQPPSTRKAPCLRRVVSGGQTGVDRAALDAALALGIECGGWCPRGRLAEDGMIPDHYPLTETDDADYRVRTEQNVIDSDGTLILHRGPIQGGTSLTRTLARRHRKPLLLIDLSHAESPDPVGEWLHSHRIERLNVAGPRESSAAGIGEQALAFLLKALCPVVAASRGTTRG